jgi:hypothetical protein
MENVSGLEDWLFEKNALTQLQQLTKDNASQHRRHTTAYTCEKVAILCNRLYNEYSKLVPPESTHEHIVLYTCQYIGFIRAQMNEIFTWRQMIKRQDFAHTMWLDHILHKLLETINRIQNKWALDFNNLPAPESEVFAYMQRTRRLWKDVYAALHECLGRNDTALLAMNVVRACRLPKNSVASRNRLRYNEVLLFNLITLIDEEGDQPNFAEQFVNLLIKEEYYEEVFVTFFIDTVTDLLSGSNSLAEMQQILTPWYKRIKNAPPPAGCFCFNFHTPEELGLPPFKQMLTEILDRYNKLVNAL